MKRFGFFLTLVFSSPAFAGTTLTCGWIDSDHNNPTFRIGVDVAKSTASAELVDGIGPGTPAQYDCQVQPACSDALSSAVTLLCMGPQMAPGAGQLLTTFVIDLANKKAASQNTLIRPSGMTLLSSFPSVQCN